jgi:hypothetical protein
MPSQAIMRQGAGIATKNFLQGFCAISCIVQLLPRQYCLRLLQICRAVHVKKEMLSGGQIAKFHELDIPGSDIRQQRP